MRKLTLGLLFLLALTHAAPETRALTNGNLTGLWVGVADYLGFPLFHNPVNLLLVESGDRLHGYAFLGVIDGKGIDFPATRILDLDVDGDTVTARLKGNQDPLDNFRPGKDEAMATLVFDRDAGTATGTWKEIGFIGRSGLIELQRISGGKDVSGSWGGQTTIAGKQVNHAFFLTAEGTGVTRGFFFNRNLVPVAGKFEGYGGTLETGKGARQAVGGSLDKASKSGKTVKTSNSVATFEGKLKRKNTRLVGTLETPLGEAPITLYHQFQKKPALPKLTMIDLQTLPNAGNRSFKLTGKGFNKAAVPTVEGPAEIVAFSTKKKTMKLTLAAAAGAMSGEKVSINVIDRAGRSAKTPLEIEIQ